MDHDIMQIYCAEAGLILVIIGKCIHASTDVLHLNFFNDKTGHGTKTIFLCLLSKKYPNHRYDKMVRNHNFIRFPVLCGHMHVGPISDQVLKLRTLGCFDSSVYRCNGAL